MSHKYTEEQNTIFFYTVKRPENLLIKARAGSGKTLTATVCASLLPKDAQITFLAFNKHNQEDIKSKLPEHIRCYTTSGVGLGALLRKYKDMQFDEFKIDKIIRRKSKTWNLESEFENDSRKIYNYNKSIKDLVNLCRVSLTTKSESTKFLANDHRINLKKDTDIKRVLKVLDEASTDRKTYDMTDMVYLPAIDKSIWFFPQDYVFFDEMQDANMCQIKIIEKMLKKDRVTGKIIGRLFSFGDPAQMIYKFNGVTNRTLEWFEKFPNTKVLSLTTSFRCAKNIIKKAQEIVPDIKAMDDAPDGVVRYDGNVLTEAKEGDFILCRTTAPLIKLFFELLSQNKKVMIKGSDIGLKLLELIGKNASLEQLVQHWNEELYHYKNSLLKEGILDVNDHSDYVALKDKVDTLLFLVNKSVNITDLKHKISTIFSDKIKGIALSSCHKMKGLENDRIFVIRPDLLSDKSAKGWTDEQEEENIEYVCITRARLELIYDMDWSDEGK